MKPQNALRQVARRDVWTDAVVIEEVFDRDVYRLNNQDLRGLRVIDVGANIGAFSLRAAWQGASVAAVEPEPENRAVMQAALGLLPHLPGHVEVVAAAVGGEKGWATVEGTGGGVAAVGADNGDVPVVTLDALIDEHEDEVYLCKIDCEGAEFDIIEASERLARIRLLTMEWHESNSGPRLGEMVRKLVSTHEITHLSGTLGGIGYLHARRYFTR